MSIYKSTFAYFVYGPASYEPTRTTPSGNLYQTFVLFIRYLHFIVFIYKLFDQASLIMGMQLEMVEPIDCTPLPTAFNSDGTL